METGAEVVTSGSAFGEPGSSSLLRNIAYGLTAGALGTAVHACFIEAHCTWAHFAI